MEDGGKEERKKGRRETKEIKEKGYGI